MERTSIEIVAVHDDRRRRPPGGPPRSEDANIPSRGTAVHVESWGAEADFPRKCPGPVLPLNRRHGRLGYPPNPNVHPAISREWTLPVTPTSSCHTPGLRCASFSSTIGEGDQVSTELVASDPWWEYASGCAVALDAGEPAPSIAVYGPILNQDEHARLCTTAISSRLVAGDGSYQRSSSFVLGSPWLMAGMLAAQGLANSRRRKQAQRDEVAQWREQHHCTVIVTDERLMCSRSDGTFIDFWFGYVNEFYPDLQSRTVTFAYGERCVPLRLAGPATVAIALWSALALYGPAWINDIRMHPLLSAQPTVPAVTSIAAIVGTLG
jgi:hypothetical protein